MRPIVLFFDTDHSAVPCSILVTLVLFQPQATAFRSYSKWCSLKSLRPNKTPVIFAKSGNEFITHTEFVLKQIVILHFNLHVKYY